MRIQALCKAFLRDRSGAAAVELVLGASLFLTVAVAASDLGVAIRGQTRIDAATREAARMMAMAPLASGTLALTTATDRVHDAFADRLAGSGLAPASLEPGAAPGAACVADRSFCWRIEPIPGSGLNLGRTRRRITVWAAARAATDMIGFLSGGDGGSVRLVSLQQQVHET